MPGCVISRASSSTRSEGNKMFRSELPLCSPTQMEFDAHVDRKLPFLVTGVADRWPAIERWTSTYLKTVLRDQILVPQVHPGGDYFDTWTRHGWPVAEEVEGSRLVDLIEQPE